ncbi:MAG: ABC transporter ATP-binding protein [Gammaproteobacteria bacterium]|nr:ABC transporter ATP-binding protein [Gammaproteobacteria bacterium]MDH5800365.1 ABC transporter ATP-binding protein [Gammaproteobacteria bacterium]
MEHIPLLQIEDLRTYFYSSAKQAFIRSVDGVDLTIEQGSTLGIVGESGSGKSITMLSTMGLISANPGVLTGKVLLNQKGNPVNLLEGLEQYVELEHNSGKILKLSKDNRAWKKQQEKNMATVRGKQISMIFQNPKAAMNPYETIGKQISEMIKLHTEIKDNNSAKEKAISWLERVKIDSPGMRFENYPHGLSGGMCQRAMIAMALSSEPSLLIADEPTTGLDATIQSKIVELLQELQTDLGITTILISHDISVITKLADSVAVMYGGKVLENGPAELVLKANEDASHPYTRALLASIPDLSNVDANGRLPAIPGEVLDTINLTQGCRFYARCEKFTTQCESKCKTQEPPLFRMDGKHHIRCWLFEKG